MFVFVLFFAEMSAVVIVSVLVRHMPTFNVLAVFMFVVVPTGHDRQGNQRSNYGKREFTEFQL